MFPISVLLIVPFYSLFMLTVWLRLSFPPLFLSAFFVIWGVVQFYVNDAPMKRQNLSLWNDKTATIPPFCLWICFIPIDALQSSKGGTTSCVNQIEPDNCLIHLQPMFVPEVRDNSLLHSCIPGENCKCLQKIKHCVTQRLLSLSLSLLLMYTTDNTIHKEPFLSYLSSCFRYFCKLQGARIINHCETRWQSASIVAKKTNETTHPGKWPGDLLWYWLPTVTEMCYTGSLSCTVPHDAPWAGRGQIRPQKQTNGALCLFVPLRGRGLISDLAGFCLTATEGIIILSEKGIELCGGASWNSLW